MIELREVPREHVDLAWRFIEPLAQQLDDVTDGVRTAASLKREAENGDVELWLIHDKDIDEAIAMVATMEITDGRGRKWGMITDGAGKDKARWVQLVVDGIRELFEKREYYGFTIMGRKGWAKDLPTFKISRVIFQEIL